MSTECERKNKWFGSCNFEPRYNTEPPKPDGMPWEYMVSVYKDDHIKSFTKRVYVCDVCTRCGKTVKAR
jgi:hypothetical protein